MPINFLPVVTRAASRSSSHDHIEYDVFPTGHRNELIPLNDSSWSFFPSIRSNEDTQRKPEEREIALCLDDKSMRWGLAP